MGTKETQALAAKPTNEIIVYQPDETVRLEVAVRDDTVWLTQQQMAELFGRAAIPAPPTKAAPAANTVGEVRNWRCSPCRPIRPPVACHKLIFTV